MADHRTLGVWDYVVLIITLLVSLGIGLYFRCTGGKQKTAKEYLLGDRNQSVLPVAISLMASVMSAVTLLGVSGEVYMYGTIFLTIIISYILFTAVAAYLYLPVFFKLQATSAYEYLERRFSPRVRIAASVLYTLQMVLYMGIVLYAPTIALEALTGLSRNTSTLVVGAVCTVYSTIGGIKAVIWTDVFQRQGNMFQEMEVSVPASLLPERYSCDDAANFVYAYNDDSPSTCGWPKTVVTSIPPEDVISLTKHGSCMPLHLAQTDFAEVACNVSSTLSDKVLVFCNRDDLSFQAGLMYAALFSVIGVAAWDQGGLLPIWRIAENHGRIQFFE
ncbi:hypothetical protein J6590_055507 [Homalodisca vitripennis]|nr:hypothetical protein J6590_055507 [Homalodisca vitripennis]